MPMGGSHARTRQIVICACLAVAFWAVAALYINLLPAAVIGPVQGAVAFLTSIPVGWFCIWLTCRLAGLTPSQVPIACLIVIGDAMMLDGVALRWFHGVYAADERTCRLGAAWLLWGYGISAWMAILMAGRGVGVARLVKAV